MIYILTSCKYNKQVKKEIYIDIHSKEECYSFINNSSDSLRFNRTLIIVKNTLSDTIIFGQSILIPKQLGEFNYTKFNNRNDLSLDLDYNNPLTNRICFSPFKRKKSKGMLILRLNTMTK